MKWTVAQVYEERDRMCYKCVDPSGRVVVKRYPKYMPDAVQRERLTKALALASTVHSVEAVDVDGLPVKTDKPTHDLYNKKFDNIKGVFE
jgi:hypothetical protein